MKAINAVYMHNVFNGIGDSIIKVFVPILILQQLGSVFFAILFVGLYCFVSLITEMVFKKPSFDNSILMLLLHIIPLILMPILIAFCPFTVTLSILLGILMGLQHGLYWTPIENLYTYSKSPINMARYDAFCVSGYLVFSLLSAFLLDSTINNSLLIVCISATLFYALSIMPLFVKRNDLLLINKNALVKQEKCPKTSFYKLYIVFWAFAATVVPIYAIVIPVYMFANDCSIQLIGIAYAITYLLEIGIDYLCRLMRLKNQHILSVAIGVVIFIASIVVCQFFVNSIMLTIACIASELSYLFIYITMQGDFLMQIQQDNCTQDGIYWKNIASNVLRTVMILVYIFVPTFEFIFIFGCVCMVVTLILTIMLLQLRKYGTLRKRHVKAPLILGDN